MNPSKKVMTIAGSDSGAGAGIQADLKTITACGCYATSVITAVTAQNTLSVKGIEPLSLGIIEQQICAIFDDIGADAVKIGMLPNGESVELIASLLKFYKATNIVLDPVLVATSGDSLAGQGTVDAMVKHLFPIATLITPNIPEAESISGVTLDSESDFERAWYEFANLGAKSVLIKAGHLSGDKLTDILYSTAFAPIIVTSQRIVTRNTHGTGCTLSSAIAAHLARGYDLEHAVKLAINYLHGAINAAVNHNIGGGHGPVDHFYRVKNCFDSH